MPFANPIASSEVDRLIERAATSDMATAIDIGCGKAEILIRLAQRYGTRGVGIDSNAAFLAEANANARDRAPGLIDLRLCDAAQVEQTPHDFGISVAAGWLLGDWHSAPRAIAKLVKPGGLVLYGDGYWRLPPTPEYLQALGATLDEMPDQHNFAAAINDAGLEIVDQTAASPQDWDRYESAWAANGEAYAAANPEEPGVADFLAWIRNGIDRASRLNGREILGFMLVLARKRPKQ